MKNLKTIGEIAQRGMTFSCAKVLFRDQYEIHYGEMSLAELKAEKGVVKNMPKNNDRRIRLAVLKDLISEEEAMAGVPELKLWSYPSCQYHIV